MGQTDADDLYNEINHLDRLGVSSAKRNRSRPTRADGSRQTTIWRLAEVPSITAIHGRQPCCAVGTAVETAESRRRINRLKPPSQPGAPWSPRTETDYEYRDITEEDKKRIIALSDDHH